MVKKKVLALTLVATMLTSNTAIGSAMAATVEVSPTPKINLEEIKSKAVEQHQTMKFNETSGEGTIYSQGEDKEKNYKASDKVRVIVTMKEGNGKTRSSISAENLNIQASVLNEMNSKSLDFSVRHQFTENTNTLTGDIEYGNIDRLMNVEGVESVRLAKEYKVDLANANSIVQAQQVWEDYGYKGEGMAVAVLDTGFQIDHPDFVLSESGKEKAKLTANNLKDVLNGTEVDDIYYNEKVPTGYDWANGDNDISPVDPFYANHGMHVAGIIGANGDTSGSGVKGIAPEVQIIGEKVFSDDGAGYEDDIIAGINHAVLVGADVINMSLGSDCGFVLEDSDLMQLAIKDASKAGVMVVVSVGNAYYSTLDQFVPRPNPFSENFDYGTVGDPSVSSYALSVASVNNNKTTVNVAELSNGEQIQYQNQIRLFPIITELLGDKEYEVVKVDGIGSNDFKNVDCKNKVVLIDKKDGDFISPSIQTNAKNNGAVAVILAGEYTNNYNVDSYYEVPVVATSKENSEKLMQAIAKDGSVKIKFTNNTTVVGSANNIDMSNFSSWGTTSTLDFKPEITGVGGEIYSTTPDGQHTTMSGTSMSSPQLAGAAALLLQHMKKNGQELKFEDVMDAKTVLMNNTKILQQEENPYSPRKQGAGLLQLENALKAPIMIYNDAAQTQEKGAFELKEIQFEACLPLVVESLTDEKLEYKLVVDLYTENRHEEEIDKNWDGIPDYTRDVTDLTSRKINGAVVSIGDQIIDENNDFIIKTKGNTNLMESKQYFDIKVDLSNVDVKDNSYIEGYVRLIPINSDYKEMSMPLLGFYGNWNDAQNIDEPMIDGEPYAEYTAVFGYDSDTPLGFNRNEAKIIEEKVAFSPVGYNNLVGVRFTALRNLEYVRVMVEDSEGNVVTELVEEKYLPKNTFYNRNIFYNFSDYAPWDGTDAEGNIVEDGKYTFVIESRFDYKNAQLQERKMEVKLDTTEPTVKNVTIDEAAEGGYDINFEVYDETSGFDGSILYIDGEYIPLEPGVTTYRVEQMPKEVVVIAFDNAANAGLGVYGDSKEISPETVLLYYGVSGDGVNYGNPASMFGAVQKIMSWELQIVGPTGDVMYELEDYVDMFLYMSFAPEQGEPNGIYTVKGRIVDKSTGIFASLEDSSFEVVDNEIFDKTALFTAIMEARSYVEGLMVGNEPGQYPKEAIDKFNEALNLSLDVYYDPAATEEGIAGEVNNITAALKVLNDSVNLSEGKISAIRLMEYCKELIAEAMIGTRPGNYGEEQYKALLSEMEKLQGLIDSEEEISDEVFNAEIAQLNKVIKAFIDSKVLAGDTTDLMNLINTEKAYLKTVQDGTSPFKYTVEAINELNQCITDVEGQLTVELTSEEVKALQDKLTLAVEKFNEGKIDIKALNKSIEKGEKYLTSIQDSLKLYDKYAVQALEASIEAGKTLVKASHTTLEQVKAAADEISNNIKKVKDSKKDDEGDKPVKPEDPQDPVDPEKPEKPTNPGGSNNNGKPNGNLPQTGAMAGTGMMTILGLASVIVGSRLRKKND